MSEPHEVIPSTPITFNFIEIRHRRDPYLPDVRLGDGVMKASVDVLFVVDGRIKFGTYHDNGLFYAQSPVRGVYRGLEKDDDGTVIGKYDGDATHWCYLPRVPHPNLMPR